MDNTANVFEENYGMDSEEESSDEPSDLEDGSLRQTLSDLSVCEELKLGISEEQARKNYEAAGTLVVEEEESITVTDYAHLMNDDVDKQLDKVVDEVKLPYRPADFQRVAVNVLGSMKSVILTSW